MKHLFDQLYEMQNILVNLLIPLVVVWLTYRLGLLTYFKKYRDSQNELSKKREYEIILSRYLENGVDLALANIEHALSIFRENYHNALALLRIFRDSIKSELDITEIENKIKKANFYRYDINSFRVAPLIKIRRLTGYSAIWDEYQDLMFFVGSTFHFFEDDLKTMMLQYLKEPNRFTVNVDELVENYINKAYEYSNKSEKYYLLLNTLHVIGEYLERQQLDFDSIAKLKDEEHLKQILNNHKEQFDKSTQRQDDHRLETIS